MADNYLEKKMEELRSGKTTSSYRGAAASYRRPGMNFPFPPRRILIATANPWREEIAKRFRATQSKVSVVDSITPDQFSQLLLSWRDIDILIADASLVAPLLPLWVAHRQKCPYVADYVTRIILMSDTHRSASPDSIISDSSRAFDEWPVPDALKATVNRLIISDPTKDISTLVATITLPGNALLNGITFQI